MKRKLLEIWGALPIPSGLRMWLVNRLVNRFPVGVVGIVLNEAGELLFFKHTYRGRFPWGLPGGWFEKDEQPAEAICREIFEEAGLRVAVDRILFASNDTRYNRIDLFFMCRIVGGDFHASAEVTEMSWFARGRLPFMMDSQYDMIRRIFQHLDAETRPEE